MALSRHCSILSAILLAIAPGAVQAAGGSPLGTWIDHSGEGAVEITQCEGKLCGRVVWLKKAENQDTCNLQVIGNVKAMSGGKWDGGWIYDPDSQNKYDVEITPVGEDRLKVYGYAGTKMFGETMTWKRAPADLKRCDKVEQAKAEMPAQVAPSDAPVAAAPPVTTPAPDAPKAAEAPQSAEVPQAPGTPAQPAAGMPAPVPAPVAVPPPVPAKKPAQVASKAKGEVFEVEGLKVRLQKGKCGVTIKELGSFDFPCD